MFSVYIAYEMHKIVYEQRINEYNKTINELQNQLKIKLIEQEKKNNEIIQLKEKNLLLNKRLLQSEYNILNDTTRSHR